MALFRTGRRRALAAALTTLLLSAVSLSTLQGAAAAPRLVGVQALPTVQVNGVVWTQAVNGDIVYAGGEFTSARPAGAPAGTSETPRWNLLAYRLSTGELIQGFDPHLNGEVRGVAVSPDGKRVYAVGRFTQVNGRAHSRIIALDPATGNRFTGFKASLGATGYAVSATSTTVYVGGAFVTANGAKRTRAAAFSVVNGALTAFAPAVQDNAVRALVLSPDQKRIVLGGSFSAVNGDRRPGRGMVSIDTKTGKVQYRWLVNDVVRNGAEADGTEHSAIYSLVSDGSFVYGSGYQYKAGKTGKLEGVFKARWSDGAISWLEDCHGDTYSVALLDGVVYTAGHAHDCSTVAGGWAEASPQDIRRAIAFTRVATGELASTTMRRYTDFGGQPAPSLYDWFPAISAGTYTGMSQGPWHVTSGGGYLVYGGEFTRVGGVGQQGLVRFKL